MVYSWNLMTYTVLRKLLLAALIRVNFIGLVSNEVLKDIAVIRDLFSSRYIPLKTGA